jgi:periplasmic divalent cation tolerance protein
MRFIEVKSPWSIPVQNYIQVTSTASSREHAEQTATMLIERRLAACVQLVGPIRSVYHWQGSIERSEEFLCYAKTRRELYDHVETAIRELHPHDEPEIIATEIVVGSRGYLDWIDRETADAQT